MATKRRRLRAALLIIGALVISALFAVKTWAGSDAMRERVRAKAVARLGEGVTLGDDFSVDWFGTVTLGPIGIAASDSTLPAVVSIKRVLVRPRWSALIRGEVEPGWVRLEEIIIEAGENGSELRALRPESTSAVSTQKQAVRQLPELHFEKLTARASFGDRPIELGAESGQLIVHRDEVAKEIHVEASLVPVGGGEISLLAAGNHSAIREAKVTIRDGVQLSGLNPLKASALTGGTLEGELQLTTAQGHHEGTLEWRVVLDAVELTQARLASSPVGPMRMATRGTLKWSDDEFTLSPLEVSFGSSDQLKVAVSARLDRGDQSVAFQAQTVDLDYQNAIASLPSALAPGELSAEVAGPFSAKVELKGPLRKPADWQLVAKIDLTALRQAARAQPHALNRPFVYKTTLYDGRPREVMVGPSNPAFVPLAEVPRSLIRAVLLSEDSMFMTHQGFDFFEMKNDLFVETEGDVVRGASTMTQQLAKNLYLSREKTYARKLREAFLTVALEAAVPKERLLEIYLNIIEWGPGLNGLGEASAHYFGKSPAHLSIKEAAYLATIIPGPIRYYSFFTKGELPEVWEHRVADLLNKMHSAGDLTDEELQSALETPLRFARKP